MTATGLREPRFEGRLYPSRREGAQPLAGRARVVVLPHGSLGACGAVLGAGVRELAAPASTALLLGPIHDPPVGGAELVGDPRAAWSLLGEVRALAPMLPGAVAGPELQDQEHGLEVVAAALVRAGYQGRLLPVLVAGWREPEARERALAAVSAWLERDPAHVVVATTDLDHYHEPAAARRAHMQLAEVLAEGDPDALLVGLEGGSFRPCGAGPVWLAMALAAQRRWRPRVLGYGWGGDVPARHVGFLAAAFEEE